MIVIAETKDHELLAALNEEVQQLHNTIHPEMFKPYEQAGMTAAFQQFLEDPACRAYVALKDDVPVGYAIINVKETEESAFHYAFRTVYVDQIVVLEQYRRYGIGKLLLEQAEQLAKELAIHKLELDHWSANTVAAGYFRKHGYTLYRERLFKMI